MLSNSVTYNDHLDQMRPLLRHDSPVTVMAHCITDPFHKEPIHVNMIVVSKEQTSIDNQEKRTDP